MIINYKELFGKENMEYKSLPPIFNENYIGQTSEVTTTRPYNYAKIMQYVRRCPEALGVINTIVTDIISDGYRFDGKKGDVKRATEFSHKNFVKDELKAALIDWLITGNFAIWLGMSENRLKERFLENYGVEMKESLPDEIWSDSRKFRHVPWSTVDLRISADGTKVEKYLQRLVNSSSNIVDENGAEIPGKHPNSGIKTREWDPVEIIHGKYLDLDGKVYGYSPMIALTPEISTLQMIKDYAGAFFDNSGIPDWMFILPNETVGSPNVTKFRQVIQQWQSSRNKHRNLVMGGEVKPQRLNEFNKDMEFRQLAVYYTAVLAFAFNMPMGKIQSILGLEISGKESELAGEAYYRSISESQDYIERLLNTQLFNKVFNVTLKINRSYKQDEIREAQRNMFNVDYLMKLTELGKMQMRKPSKQMVDSLLTLDESLWDPMTEKDLEMLQTMNNPGNRQDFQGDSDTVGNNPRSSAQKKNEQNKSMEKKGNKPLGA